MVVGLDPGGTVVMPGRLATIDVGTNTALLLVSEWLDGRLVVHHDETRYVRLGEGVDATGEISPRALGRLRFALEHFGRVASTYDVVDTVVTGTSASRDASNPEDLDRVARETVGSPYRILTGEEEADVAFLGAVAGVRAYERAAGLTTADRIIIPDQPQRASIIDVGGGSTEVVQGLVEGLHVFPQRSVSMNIGSVRMTERHFSSLPPSDAEFLAASDWLDGMLDDSLGDFERTDLCIGSSGTAIILGRLHEEAPYRLPASTLHSWRDRLRRMSEEQVRALNPSLMEGRADVFAAAVTILAAVVDRVGGESMTVSTYGVRHGVAMRYFQENRPA